jgi:zinc transport system substrate-binding protein
MMRFLLAGLSLCLACTVAAEPAPSVVASTAWVAALARAAGATQVTLVAPPGLAHPPDYDPKPSDLLAVSRADLVLVGGYESFVSRLRSALGGRGQMLVVTTSYDPKIVRQEVAAIAAALGTRAQAEAFAARYERAWRESAERLQKGTGDRSPVVVAQRFMVPWVPLLGVEPAGTFGPGPVSPEDLRRLKALRPTLIVDNAHAAPAAALAEVTGARRVALVNFPEGDEGLLEVLRRNVRSLDAALAR